MINELKILEDGTLIVKTDQYDNVKRVLVEDGTNGTLYYADTFSYHPVKEPPVVGIFRNCSGIRWDCEDCKFDNRTANDYPCRMCTGDTFNAFEPMEGWAEDAEMRSEE